MKYFNLDGVNLLILVFVLYILISFSWGKDYKSGVKIFLPFSAFICGRVGLRKGNDEIRLYRYFIYSYIIPIIGSAIFILLEISPETTTNYWTGIKRHSGMYFSIHAMAHSMLVFIFVCCLLLNSYNKLKNNNRLFTLMLFVLLMFSLYNIFMSGTRTVIIGLLLFSIIYLFGRKKYKLIVIILVGISIYIAYSSYYKILMWDIIQPLEGREKIEKMGSGRIGLWKNELSGFNNEPIEIQIIGKGFGNQISTLGGIRSFSTSHNDLLALLVNVGYIGFGLYIAIFVKMFFDVLLYNKDFIFKMTFIGILLSVIFMNFSSNSYLTRFELAQSFMFIMSIFYSRKNCESS